MNYLLWCPADCFEKVKQYLEAHGYITTSVSTDWDFLMIIPERKVFEKIGYRTLVEFRELFNGYKLITIGDIYSLIK